MHDRVIIATAQIFNAELASKDKIIKIYYPIDMMANADASNTTVLKITRFLMTLDSDGDATNGITISDAAKTAAQSASQIDFSTATDADITSALSPLTTKTLVGSSDAQTHLTISVYGLYAGTYSGTCNYRTNSGSEDSGTWTWDIDSSGAITGTGTSSIYGNSSSVSGQDSTSGATTSSTSGSGSLTGTRS